MQRFLFFCCFLSLVGSFSFSQNRPLITETPETVEAGALRVSLGFEFYQGASFPLAGLEGDLIRLGVFDLRFGVGERVEIQVAWPAQDFLNIESRTNSPISDQLDFLGNSTSDFGDLTLSTKVRVSEGDGKLPAFGLQFGVKLPNASASRGLGTNETDFFGGLLLSKRLNRWTLLGNAGMVILGDPVSSMSQDDLMTYGVAFLYDASSQVRLFADLNGRYGSGGWGTEERSSVRLGGQVNWAGLWWDAALYLGIEDVNPDQGIVFGVSRDIRFR